MLANLEDLSEKGKVIPGCLTPQLVHTRVACYEDALWALHAFIPLGEKLMRDEPKERPRRRLIHLRYEISALHAREKLQRSAGGVEPKIAFVNGAY